MKVMKPLISRLPNYRADPQRHVGGNEMHKTEAGEQTEFLDQDLTKGEKKNNNWEMTGFMLVICIQILIFVFYDGTV